MKADAILIPVPPCAKCGANDRYTDGRCKACCRVKSAAYRSLHREEANACAAAWLVANKQRRREYEASPLRRSQSRARYAANPEILKSAVTAWKKANPEAKKRENHSRRAKKLGAGGTLSKGLQEKLFSLQKGKCPCCKRPLGNDYHLDHKMPLALGGTNTDDNMQLLRAKCNMKKSAKDPVDFMQSRGFLL